MCASKSTSVEELQILSRFQSLRKILLSEPYLDCVDKPLAYWALPTDRRLPLAFLGRSLRDLLTTPLSELAATPGIGPKKIGSLVKLLARAANADPGELSAEVVSVSGNGKRAATARPTANRFAPGSVSEVVWSRWRECVRRHGLGAEALGLFAPSLKRMTRVIWKTPLEEYTDMTLAQMRQTKTHGEKRVRAILEVFHCIHKLFEGMGAQDHLVVRIVPRRIDSVESWVGRALQTPGVPDGDEIRDRLIEPILGQIRNDASQQIVQLAESRLGLRGGAMISVRRAARDMVLTRARVYQLLNKINDIMTVRWPMGRHQLYELHSKFESEAAAVQHPTDLRQFRAALELFYPGSRRGAAGPMEVGKSISQPERGATPSRDPRSRARAELMEVAG